MKRRTSLTFGKPPSLDEVRAPAPRPARNPLLLMGNLLRDHATVGEKLKGMHLDAAAYHGNLQVCLSAVRRMEGDLVTMLGEHESE